MREEVHAERSHGDAHEDAHWGETVLLPGVHQDLLREGLHEVTHEDAHGGETVQLLRLQQEVHLEVAAQEPQV